MYGNQSLPSIVQWMDYHRASMGIDHFILYDAGEGEHTHSWLYVIGVRCKALPEPRTDRPLHPQPRG